MTYALTRSERPKAAIHIPFWRTTLTEVLAYSRALAHRIRNRLIVACLQCADRLEKAEARAIVREASLSSGPRPWPLGLPPPAPSLRPGRFPSIGFSAPATVSTNPRADSRPTAVEETDFDDAPTTLDELPTAVYHPKVS